MRKLLFACFTLLAVLVKAQSFNFTITNQSSSYSITCTNTVVSLYAIASSGNSLQCTWVGPGSNSVTGNPQVFTAVGNYTVTVKDVITNSVASQQFSIYQNTVAPTSSVSPNNQITTCVSSAATFTSIAITPTTNIEHRWYSPASTYPSGPLSQLSNNAMSLYNAMIPGAHTVAVCNLVNGCCTSKTFTVTSTSGFPTFNMSSTTNFSVGCTPLNQTTLCIVGVQSSSNGPVNFALLPPGTFSSVPLPPGAFSNTSCTVTAIPGTWTLVTQDQFNGCQSAIPVIVMQNTTSPAVPDVSIPTKTLTCFNPTILAMGFCQAMPADVTWQVPSVPSNVASSSVIVGPPTGPSTSPTNTNYATYTVVATNTVNLCKSYSVITISQNFKVPTPLLALGNPSVINCIDTAVVISYTNNAANSIPGAIGVVDSWMGPTQSATASVNTFTAYSPGVYTLTVHDNYNGCVGSVWVNIPSNGAGCTGFKTNLPKDELVTLYPNPASGFVDININDNSSATLLIMDVQGRVISKQVLSQKTNRVLLQLAKGLYIARVIVEGKGYKDEKLVVE